MKILMIIAMELGINQVYRDEPTETLHISGEARFEYSRTKWAKNAIYTRGIGSRYHNKNQAFNANKTVVVDYNGVFGFLTDVSSVSKASRFASSTIIFLIL